MSPVVTPGSAQAVLAKLRPAVKCALRIAVQPLGHDQDQIVTRVRPLTVTIRSLRRQGLTHSVKTETGTEEQLTHLGLACRDLQLLPQADAYANIRRREAERHAAALKFAMRRFVEVLGPAVQRMGENLAKVRMRRISDHATPFAIDAGPIPEDEMR
jgi:hypothetical protein